MQSKTDENERLNSAEERDSLQQIIEGLLMASDDPLTVGRLQQLLSRSDFTLSSEEIAIILGNIASSTEGRAFMLKEVAGGWRFQIRPEYSHWVQLLWEERPPRYSRALLEILAIIAYRQPITRPEIEQIRGVAVSSSIVKTLSEREWIRVVGHRDVPGTPALYATTKHFLDYFNLKSLDELPSLPEFESLEASEKILEEMDVSSVTLEPSEASSDKVAEVVEQHDENGNETQEAASVNDETANEGNETELACADVEA